MESAPLQHIKKYVEISHNSVTMLSMIICLGMVGMRYTVEDGGRLNNYAVEPKMYEAEPPTSLEKRNYAILGTIAAALVASVVVIAFVVS